jgi:predicted ester cyclase
VTSSKDIVLAFHETVWSEGRLDRAGEFLAADLVDHRPLEFPGRAGGAEGLLQVVRMIRAALPDLTRTVDEQVVEGDRVVTRFTDRGTHQGELLGIAPTGREVAVQGVNIEVVGDGLIREVWHLEDLAGLMAQIGAAPAPPAPASSQA